MVIMVSKFDKVDVKEDQKTEFKQSIFIDHGGRVPGFMQTHTIAETISRLLEVAALRGVRLLVLTGEPQDKKSFADECAKCAGLEVVRLGAELSCYLRYKPCNGIGCETLDFLDELHADKPLFLDEIELLFDSGMDINVLSVLKYAARTRLLVVNWPGSLDADGGVLYFARGDVQQKSYPVDSEIIVFDESGTVLPENI